MKGEILGLIIILAAILTSYHFYIAHFTKDQYPPDLILGFMIMYLVGLGLVSSMITVKKN